MEPYSTSLRLNRAADYAIRVMIHLATLPRQQRVALPALAEATGAPSTFLSKVLQALSRALLVSSRRGQQGGFEILDRGRRASIREIIEAIDGPICLNVCLIDRRSCSRKPFCSAHPVWVQAQSALLSVLNSAIVADLASGAKDKSLILPRSS